MEISKEQSLEVVETSLDDIAETKEGGSVVMAMDKGKDGPAHITEGEAVVVVVTIHHAEEVSGQTNNEPDREFSKVDSSKYRVFQMAN